jgi:Tol biopolymer transport system component
MRTVRSQLGRAVVAAASLIAACGGGAGDGGGGASGMLVFSRPDGIVEMDLASGEILPVLRPDLQTSFILDPAVSPDGQRIAYIVQPPPRVVDGRYDAGSDLWIANRDGGDARMLYQHEQLNALVRFPQWAGDGHVLAFVQEITPSADPAGIASVAYTVQRFDAATGVRELLLDDAIAFTLSPDGQRIAYSRFVASAGSEMFESVALAGGEPEVLVAPEANLNPYNSPRYSPDGTAIAFASADQAQTAPGGRLSAPLVAPRLDGFPQDIWLVDAGGGTPRLLADLKEDLPSLAWSDDGEHLFALGANGLYDIEVGTGAVERIGEGAFHATVDWTP